jgi:hypothetical protein
MRFMMAPAPAHDVAECLIIPVASFTRDWCHTVKTDVKAMQSSPMAALHGHSSHCGTVLDGAAQGGRLLLLYHCCLQHCVAKPSMASSSRDPCCL